MPDHLCRPHYYFPGQWRIHPSMSFSKTFIFRIKSLWTTLICDVMLFLQENAIQDWVWDLPVNSQPNSGRTVYKFWTQNRFVTVFLSRQLIRRIDRRGENMHPFASLLVSEETSRWGDKALSIWTLENSPSTAMIQMTRTLSSTDMRARLRANKAGSRLKRKKGKGKSPVQKQ